MRWTHECNLKALMRAGWSATSPLDALSAAHVADGFLSHDQQTQHPTFDLPSVCRAQQCKTLCCLQSAGNPEDQYLAERCHAWRDAAAQADWPLWLVSGCLDAQHAETQAYHMEVMAIDQRQVQPAQLYGAALGYLQDPLPGPSSLL